MILVNVTPDSLDGDVHAVPTVHIDAVYRDALLADLARSPGATATLAGGNLTGAGIPTPQIAGFSGRGPLADDSDILAPDVAAPGVAILAATADTSDGDPTWGIASGTSLAAPHVAGLAALYLEARPAATPDEIKSALMTTASNTLNADGSANVDPVRAGRRAGRRRPLPRPRAALPERSAASGRGSSRRRGTGNPTVPTCEGSELNLPSIAIGALTEEHLITRTLTATRAGTYDVAADIPGVDVSVSPATLTFAAPGDTQQFTVSFTNDTAPVEVWATGLLTWTGEDGTSVRSPLAVRPVTADAADPRHRRRDRRAAPRCRSCSGVTGELTTRRRRTRARRAARRSGRPGTRALGRCGHRATRTATSRGSSRSRPDPPLARFTLDASDDSDLDLAVYRVARPRTTALLRAVGVGDRVGAGAGDPRGPDRRVVSRGRRRRPERPRGRRGT